MLKKYKKKNQLFNIASSTTLLSIFALNAMSNNQVIINNFVSHQISALAATNSEEIINQAKAYGITPNTNKVVSLADYNINGDGKTDVTAKIQQALNDVNKAGGGIVYIPAGTYMVKADDSNPVLGWQKGTDGLQVGSNTTVLLAPNATLKAIKNPASGYTVLNLNQVNNVNILGGTVSGERNDHELTTPFNIRNGKPFYGEWGTGTNVIGGSNINLIGTHYIDSWGDGVSVFPNMNMAKDPNGGALAHQTQGLVIKNCVFDNNRRQGVSLGNIKNATIENNLFENTNGTGPASGMDLEPGGDSNQIVENVNIKHNTFINNTNQGLTMYAAQGTHVRNITVDGNTFSNNGSWATGQIITNTVEGVEIKNNKILSNDGSRFFNIWLIGTSNANVHDNYGPNGSIVIAKDNPAVGYPTPSGTVKNNYISSITNDYGNAYSVTNNHLPNECTTVSQKGDPNDWSKNITHPNAITNEKVVFHDFTDRSGKPITTVSSNPKNTVIGNSDMLRWKADFSFDISGKLLKQTTTGDDHIHFEKPMFTIYHNPDDQANLSEDQLYLGNQGADLVVNGQVVGKLFSSYIETNGTYTGSDDTVHVEVKNIPMGDGRLHVNNLQNNSAAVTIITTADGNKYAYTAQSSKGDTNIPTDQSLVQNNNTNNDKPNSDSSSSNNNSSSTNSNINSSATNSNTNSSSANNSSANSNINSSATNSNTNSSSTNSSSTNSNINSHANSSSSANSSINSSSDSANSSSTSSSVNSNVNSSSANSTIGSSSVHNSTTNSNIDSGSVNSNVNSSSTNNSSANIGSINTSNANNSVTQSSAAPSNAPSSATSSSVTPSDVSSSATSSDASSSTTQSSSITPASSSATPSDVSSSANPSSAAPQTQSSSSETNAVTSAVTNAVTSTVTNNVTHNNVPSNASANSNSNNNTKTATPQTNGNILNSNLVQTNATYNQQNNGLALMMLGTSTLLIGIGLNKIKLE